MKTQFIYSFFIVTILLFSSCKSIDLSSSQYIIEYVKYGTSFGHCVGLNCNKSYTFSKNEISYARRANGHMTDSLVQRTSIETEQWENLINSIKDSGIKKLPNRIGCPDCADGGSEWVEINEGNKITRVTFEYGNAPNEIKSVIRIAKRLSEVFAEEN